jgi:hypothetical protein
MRRLLVVVFLIGLALLGPASIARADKPQRQDVPDFEPFIVSGICSFDVRVTQLVNEEVTSTFQDGRQQTTGQLRVRLTNIATGKSIDVNVSGPVTYTPNPDGSFTAVFRGRSLIFPNDPNAPPAQQHIFWVASGRVVMTVSGDFAIFSLVHVVGTTLDICQTLA